MRQQDSKGQYLRMIMSGMAILVGGVLAFGLIFQAGQNNISTEYLVLYGLIAVFSIIFGSLAFFSDFALKRVRPNSILARSLFIFERTILRPGSLWIGIPLLIAGVISVLLAGIVTSTGNSIFSTPNPYSASMQWEPLALDGQNTLLTLFNGAVIPGWFEEAGIFFAIQLSIFIILWALWLIMGRRDEIVSHPFIYWFIALPMIAVWSVVFSLAHGRYGGNIEALAFAFIFEFTVQLLNQVTGSFVSWIPHMVHNSVVIANRSFSFVTLSIFPIASPDMIKAVWFKITHSMGVQKYDR